MKIRFPKIIKNQKGSIGFEALLVVMVLVIGGFAAHFAMQARQDRSDYSVNIPHHKTYHQVQAPKSDVKHYDMKLTEMGIKLSLPSDLNDVVYIVNTTPRHVAGTDGQGNILVSVSFSTKSLIAAGGQRQGRDACGPDSKPIGTISKFDKGLNGTKKIGNNYYLLEGPQASCGVTRDADPIQTKQFEIIQAAFGNAQPL